MASCARCGGPFGACDQTMYCRRCAQIAALKLAHCDRCIVDTEYDSAGHLVITHRPGCPEYREFAAKLADIDSHRGDDERRGSGRAPR